MDVGRRLETRVFFHHTQGWRGYTYKWNAAQTDADLLEASVTETYTVDDPAARTARQEEAFLAATNDTMTDLIIRRRDECMKQLMQIADGTINPGGNVPGASGSNKLTANTRQLTRDNLCRLF